MITHKQYMADSSKLFHAYHLEIAQACGISFVKSDKLPAIILALTDGDEHLNTILLKYWDMLALANKPLISSECKKRGTFYSLATGVCVMKSAAKEAAKQKPLEWAELWAAMRPTPYPWILTTENMFNEMLGAVPPRAMGNGCFLMGEPFDHNSEGKAIYACFKHIHGGGVEARYMTSAEFAQLKTVRA